MKHFLATLFHKIIGHTHQKTTHFISSIRRQRQSIYRQLNELQRVFLDSHTFLMKVDEFFNFCLSFVPWEESIKKCLPKISLLMGPLSLRSVEPFTPMNKTLKDVVHKISILIIIQ